MWCLLFLEVCCMISGHGKSMPAEERHLYEELKLEKTVGFPAFQEALQNYPRYTAEKPALLALIDFTKPSTEKRFCVIDLQRKLVLFRSHVAHGRNSGDNYAVSFSNRPGSFQSSLGFFRTGNTYYGKNGYSLLLEGLEPGINDKARERNIVMHGAAYADPSFARSRGRLGRSLGCPALPPAVSRQVIDTLKNGALLYIHGKQS